MYQSTPKKKLLLWHTLLSTITCVAECKYTRTPLDLTKSGQVPFTESIVHPSSCQPYRTDLDELIGTLPNGAGSEQQSQLLSYGSTAVAHSQFTNRTVSEIDNISSFLQDQVVSHDYFTPTGTSTATPYQTTTMGHLSDFRCQHLPLTDFSAQSCFQMSRLNHSLKSQKLFSAQLTHEIARLKSENQLLRRKCRDLADEKQILNEKNHTLEHQLKEERTRTTQLTSMHNKIKAIDKNVTTLGEHVVEITSRFKK